MNCLTTAGTVMFILLIIIAYVVGFFMGKKHGVKVVTTVMKEKHKIDETWENIKNEYNKLKTKI